jgi:hypothetical protein
MRRIRLSTLMLLIVIAAQGFALALQHVRTVRRERELEAKRKEVESMISWYKELVKIKDRRLEEMESLTPYRGRTATPERRDAR